MILVTLIGQGLTLGPLIRLLGVHDDGADQREEVEARVRIAEAGIARVDELANEDWVRDDDRRVRALLDTVVAFRAADGGGDSTRSAPAATSGSCALYDAQRERPAPQPRRDPDEVRRRVEREPT